MRISREASAHWSVDGSLNYNYSYSRTFTAVTPRYRTWRARPEPTTHAQLEFELGSGGLGDDFLSSSSLLSFPRLAGAWSPEVDSSPSPSSAPWSGNASTLARSTPGRSGRTRTEKGSNTLCTWWLKGRSWVQRMQLWRRSSCRQTSPRPLRSSSWTLTPKKNSCHILRCSKGGFYKIILNTFTCIYKLFYTFHKKNINLFTFIQILAKLSPGTHKYKQFFCLQKVQGIVPYIHSTSKILTGQTVLTEADTGKRFKKVR